MAKPIKVQTLPVTASSRLVVFRLALVVCAAVSAVSCGREIGDECVTAADCNPNWSRSCDVSQPGGYCTIMGCDEKSCPSEAVCIRYFPAEFLTLSCNPCCEDWPLDPMADPETWVLPPGCTASDCPGGGLLDECTVDEICLERVCAPRSTERRFCAKTCDSNDDCRGGYECRLSGTRGSLALTSSVTSTARFCAPIVR
jgi:hypothetical protein